MASDPTPNREEKENFTIRIEPSLRAQIKTLAASSELSDAVVARDLMRFGLRAASRHGFYTLQGLLQRNLPVELERSSLDQLYQVAEEPPPPPAKPKR